MEPMYCYLFEGHDKHRHKYKVAVSFNENPSEEELEIYSVELATEKATLYIDDVLEGDYSGDREIDYYCEFVKTASYKKITYGEYLKCPEHKIVFFDEFD